MDQKLYDFYLISQSVGQGNCSVAAVRKLKISPLSHFSIGTVSPTHYHVVYDNSGLQADHIQQLTYKLCHMYFNW